MKKRVKIMLLAVLAVICAAAYGVVLLQPVPVGAETVKRENLERTVTVEGTLLPRESMIVNAADSGTVKEVLCRQGTQAKTGEILARTDADSAVGVKLQREQLLVQLAAARQEYDRLYGTDGAAASEFQTAEGAYSLAQKNYENKSQLFQEGYISQVELDEAKNSRNQAYQVYRQAKLQNSESTRSFYREQVESCERQMELLEDATAAGTVLMPYDGVVWEVYVENGGYVSANQPLFKVYRSDQMKLEASVLSEDGAGLEPGMKASVRYADGTESEAEITFLSAVAVQMVSSIGMEENRCTVELEPDTVLQNVGAGQRADVTFCIRKGENIITVPSSAIVVSEEGKAVYVIRRNRAEQIQVETGQRESGRIEILSGLEEGDVVVADPYENDIRSGMRVKAETE